MEASKTMAASSQQPSSQKAIFKQGYLLNKDTLLPIAPEYISNNSPVEKKFRSIKELETLMIKNSKTLFGKSTFIVQIQKKTEAIFGNDSVPTGFMLDADDSLKPRFYILDIMHSEQSFFSYVFPRITKFFSLFRNEESVDKLCDLMGKDKEIRKALQDRMEGEHIATYLKQAITGKPVILLVMDCEMKELPEILATYPETWQRVKQLLIQKYSSNGNTFCTLYPSFVEITRKEKEKKSGSRNKDKIDGELSKEKIEYSEEDHLQNTSEDMRAIYSKLKADLLKVNNQLQFNPQKYYISLKKDANLAFFHFSRKKISIVVKHPEMDTRKMLKHHEVKTLTEKVQKFWNGSSCTVMIEGSKHLNEVTSLLKKLITE